MKTFKEFKRELPEDYASAFQKLKTGASEIGSGAVEAGKTFIKRDLPVAIKKGEEEYQKAKPLVKKAVGAVGSATEQGGKAVKQWANEDLEEILLFVLDESIDEEIRLEIFESVFGIINEKEGDWKQTAKDFLRGGAKGVTFGYSPEIMAKLKTGFDSGDEYKKELEKQQQADVAAQQRSPTAYGAGEIGSMFVGPGGAVLGAAKGIKAARGAVAGVSAASKAKRAAGAAEAAAKAEKRIQMLKSAGKSTAKAEKSLVGATKKAEVASQKAATAKSKLDTIKSTSVLKPTIPKVAATIAGTALAANTLKKPPTDAEQRLADMEKRKERAEELKRIGKERTAEKAQAPTDNASGKPKTTTPPTQPKVLPGSKPPEDKMKSLEAETRSLLQARNKHTGIESNVDSTINRLKSDPRAEKTMQNFIDMQKKENQSLGVK